MSLYDTIVFSKVSKKLRYFKKFYSTENISFLVESIPNLQTKVYFQENKKPFLYLDYKKGIL